MDNSSDRISKAYEEYYNLIYRICLDELYYDTHNAEDVTEDVFVTFVNNIHKVKQDKTKAWLTSTAKRKLKEFKRNYKKKYDYSNIDEFREYLPDLNATDIEEILLNDSIVNLDIEQEVFDSLRPIEQQLIICIHDKKMSYAMMSDELNLTKAEIAMRIHRLKKKVKKLINDKLNSFL